MNLNHIVLMSILFLPLTADAKTIYAKSKNAPQIEKDKIQEIAQFFSPKPGEMVLVDSAEARDYEEKIEAIKLRGYIKISPPKGQCYRIQKNVDLPDETVCSPTTLSFSLVDLTISGQIAWRIMTGPNDFGHLAYWSTPYRLAQVISYLKNAETEYRVIKSCDAKTGFSKDLGRKDRRVYIQLFGGEKWVISFPERDVLLPQPPPPSNLPVLKPAKRGGPGRVMSTGYDEDEEAAWMIPARDTFVMDASSFITQDSGPRGKTGKCRYQLKNAPDDKESGWIECHDADKYKIVYTYLPCTKALR